MGQSGGKSGLRAVLLLLPLALLVGVAVWQLLRPLGMPEPPGPQAWLDAARYVRSGFRPGDVVRIEPTWLTQGRVYFGDIDSGPRTPMRVLDLHAPLDLPFLYRFQRLWLITAVEQRSSGDALLTDRFERLDEVEFPGLTVSLYQVPQGLLLWQMREGMSAAVLASGGAGSEACPWRQDRFRCAGQPVADVRFEMREVAGGPRQCLLVKPEPEGRQTVLQFPSLDREGELLVRAGNTVEAARSKDGGTVLVEVELDGNPVGSMSLQRASYRLDEVRATVQGGGPHELEIRLSTDDATKREVCLDGFILAPGQ